MDILKVLGKLDTTKAAAAAEEARQQEASAQLEVYTALVGLAFAFLGSNEERPILSPSEARHHYRNTFPRGRRFETVVRKTNWITVGLQTGSDAEIFGRLTVGETYRHTRHNPEYFSAGYAAKISVAFFVGREEPFATSTCSLNPETYFSEGLSNVQKVEEIQGDPEDVRTSLATLQEGVDGASAR